VSKFRDYGALSGNIHEQDLQVAVRVEADPLKQDPRDFTLWKRGEPGRELVWDSPWGRGFPGWHIECSAMSMKYLGEQFDIHTGGVDNIFPHHEDEIAQSEAFTGERVVTTWLHAQHLLADGVKMAKSAGNSFTLADIESQGIDPLALRYLCLTARYSTRLDFTFTSLKAAQRGLLRLQNRMWEWSSLPGAAHGDEHAQREWEGRFIERVNENLDMPGALALTWELAHSDLPPHAKRAALVSFDRVLGLGLDGVAERYNVPLETIRAVEHRSGHRRRHDYAEADAHRTRLAVDGYVLEDARDGTRVRPKTLSERREEVRHTISSPVDVASLIEQPDVVDISVAVVGDNHVDDLSRCVQSALTWGRGRSIEIIVVDNGSTEGVAEWLDAAAVVDERVRVFHTDHVLGEAAAKNVLLKQGRGRVIVMLDTSAELSGDAFGPIEKMLEDDTVGVAGPLGLRTDDLRHFQDAEAGDVDAMQSYCFAFRRSRLADVGLMKNSYRFYRNLDLDYSFRFKELGYRIVADPTLPIKLHEHRVWSALSEEEREELSRKNFRRFLHKWGHRTDLLVGNGP
jgi:cysteinyl-tRNA synthetase